MEGPAPHHLPGISGLFFVKIHIREGCIGVVEHRYTDETDQHLGVVHDPGSGLTAIAVDEELADGDVVQRLDPPPGHHLDQSVDVLYGDESGVDVRDEAIGVQAEAEDVVELLVGEDELFEEDHDVDEWLCCSEVSEGGFEVAEALEGCVDEEDVGVDVEVEVLDAVLEVG